VLFVEVAYGGLGADYSVHSQLTEALAPSGAIEVMSLSHPDLAASQPDDHHRVPCAAYDFGDRALRRRLSVVTDLPVALRGALPAVREFAPDVVYSSQLRRDAMAAHAVSALTRLPHVVHLHYSFGPWLGRAAVRTIRRAHHVVAVSEYVRQTTLLRGLSGDRVTTVPNLTSANPTVEVGREAKRAELGIADDDVVVIGVGRLDRGKGFTELVDAVSQLGDRHVQLLVCGASNHSPGHDREIARHAAELGLDSTVQFLGQRPDVPELMNAADVFCLPSHMEPFGLVYIEAMRAGLPVVALRSGGVPEIVVDGVTGLLSYPGDQHELVEHLATLVDDPDLRAAYGEAGRARLATHFDNDTIAARWMATMDGALGRS
jgi:glycosyltransferase involved in cell wall biosynthesis